MADGRRPKRVAEGVREYLSATIVTELADPGLAGLVITRVEVTADLGIADAYFRLMTSDVLTAAQKQVARRQAERTLARAASRLRRGLAALLKAKRTPELRFFFDADPDKRERVDELLSEITAEQGEREHESVEPETADKGNRSQ